ncbi:MAG: hypothetical protein EXQ70_05170 [Solirubrobacterales bacterium]|nr:hypothetical protein [Solirubrobacterales bacterium]
MAEQVKLDWSRATLSGRDLPVPFTVNPPGRWSSAFEDTVERRWSPAFEAVVERMGDAPTPLDLSVAGHVGTLILGVGETELHVLDVEPGYADETRLGPWLAEKLALTDELHSDEARLVESALQEALDQAKEDRGPE